jgi:hypothetical protein
MLIPVLIERVPGDGFRAKGGEPLPISAEGATRSEAVARLIVERLSPDAELISLELEPREHPIGPVPGWSEDDALLDEWQEAVEAYRHQVEDDPNR